MEAGFSNTLWRIILPITKPILVTVAIIQIFSCWNEFSFTGTDQKMSLQTVPLALTQFKGQLHQIIEADGDNADHHVSYRNFCILCSVSRLLKEWLQVR